MPAMSQKKQIRKLITGTDTNIRGIDKNELYEWNKRVLIFTPTTGNVRIEWVNARYGQIIPTNWSNVQMQQFLSPYVPVEYQLADAQNLMAKKVVEEGYEWIIYIEHDNIVPEDLFVKFGQYINEKKVPIVSGLYFTKQVPAEPIMYRGRGNSYYGDWKLGDKVWVDGIPFGCRLEHASFIKEAWKDSPEYMVGNTLTRRVFEQPNRIWYDPEKGGMASKSGTTDLAWCSRIMNEGLFEKCGWSEYEGKPFPFLVDTTIFVGHIDGQGRIFPLQIPEQFLPDKNKKNVRRKRKRRASKRGK